MKDLTYESMTVLYLPRFNSPASGDWKVRVWRAEPDDAEPERQEMYRVRNQLSIRSSFEMRDILAAFAALPRVSAVEVTDHEGDGIVYFAGRAARLEVPLRVRRD